MECESCRGASILSPGYMLEMCALYGSELFMKIFTFKNFVSYEAFCDETASLTLSTV